MDNDKNRYDERNDAERKGEAGRPDFLSEGPEAEGTAAGSGEAPEFSRTFKVDYHSADDWSGDGEQEVPEAGADPEERRIPGFLRRIIERGDTGPTEEEMTREAQEQIRQHYRSPLFDEEQDRHIAEESTRSIPVDLLETERELTNPAARRMEEADSRAARLEDKELRGGRRKEVSARNEMDELVREGPEPMSDRELKSQRWRNRAIVILVVAAAALILFLTAPLIQASLFRTEGDSLIFNPAGGLFGPRAGVVEIFIGLLGAGLVIWTLMGARRNKAAKNQAGPGRGNQNLFRTIGLVLLIFLPVGISSLFNFTEFRNNDIRFASIFDRDRTYSYDSIVHQDVMNQGEEVFYTLETGDGRSSRLNVSDLPAETVRLLDAKLAPGRVVRFTSTAVDQLVEQGIYTWEEAIRIYAPRD